MEVCVGQKETRKKHIDRNLFFEYRADILKFTFSPNI